MRRFDTLDPFITSALSVDWNRPVNRGHPLIRGMLGWWKVTPFHRGGLTIPSLLGDDRTLTAQNSAVLGWAWSNPAAAPPGGWTSINQNGHAGVYRWASPTIPIATNKTFATWLRVDTVGLFRPFMGLDSGGATKVCYASTGNTFVRYNNDPTASFTHTTGKWNHVVFRSDGSNGRFFFNGRPDSATGSRMTDSGDIAVSWTGSGPGSGSVDGDLNDFRVWNRALTDEEIWHLYLDDLSYNAGTLRRWRRRAYVDLSGAGGSSRVISPDKRGGKQRGMRGGRQL